MSSSTKPSLSNLKQFRLDKDASKYAVESFRNRCWAWGHLGWVYFCFVYWEFDRTISPIGQSGHANGASTWRPLQGMENSQVIPRTATQPHSGHVDNGVHWKGQHTIIFQVPFKVLSRTTRVLRNVSIQSILNSTKWKLVEFFFIFSDIESTQASRADNVGKGLMWAEELKRLQFVLPL